MGFGNVSTSGGSKRGGFGSVGAEDLSTSEGLYNVAQNAGGSIARKADEIVGKEKSLLSKVGGGLKTGLGKVLDVAQRFNYAGASATKNIIDNDANTTFTGGLASGITGKTKHTYSDVFEEAGWNPTSKLGKFSKGATGFALDVLLDPTTYVTFGAGAGVKLAVAGGTKTLTKAGAKELARQKAVGLFSEEFVKESVAKMAERSPELYQKFIDQGGIKFFGETIISGGRIAAVAKSIPGMTKLDETTQPVRNTLYALFNRDASAKFGDLNKLGQVSAVGKTGREFVQFQNRLRDLGKVRGEDALNGVVDIAKANKLTAQEAEIISNAIETKLPLADDRLENARKLLEQGLGRNLKAEQQAGIEVGELPNYVAHILVDPKASKAFSFKPQGVRVSLGASKERTIGKVVSETGEIQVGKDLPEKMKLKEIEMSGAVDSSGKKMTGQLYVDENAKVYQKGQATIEEINSAFGKEFFDPNVINTAAIRSVASARAVTSQEFMNGAKAFGASAATAPSGFVEVGAKELAGLKFHPAIAEQIDKFKQGIIDDDATNNLLKAYDKVQNLWKASVTSIFPAFHGRNGISNVFLNYLDLGKAAFSPGRHVISLALLKNNRDLELLQKAVLVGGDAGKKAQTALDALKSKPILTDDFGKKWTFGELRDEMRNKRVAFGNEFTGFLDVRETVQDKLGTAVAGGSKAKSVGRAINPFSENNAAFRAGRNVGNLIEQQARILNFLTNLERTGDVVTSAERSKQFLFDYTNLSVFEKNVMKRLIPFYTFTRKNLELQVTQLAKQPGKLATQAKIFSSISDLLAGGQLSDEERKNLPQFLQEGLGIVYKRDGKDVTVINSLGLPVEQIFSNLKPNAILGSMSPVIAVPLQVAIGKHFFFDRDLEDVNDATAYQKAPQAIKDYIGFTVRKNKDGSDRYIALNPTRLFILNNIPPSSRVVSTIGQLEAQNVSGKLKVLRQLTGIKPYGEDLELQAQIKEKAMFRNLQDMLDTSGTAPVYKRTFIPKKK